MGSFKTNLDIEVAKAVCNTYNCSILSKESTLKLIEDAIKPFKLGYKRDLLVYCNSTFYEKYRKELDKLLTKSFSIIFDNEESDFNSEIENSYTTGKITTHMVIRDIDDYLLIEDMDSGECLAVNYVN